MRAEAYTVLVWRTWPLMVSEDADLNPACGLEPNLLTRDAGLGIDARVLCCGFWGLLVTQHDYNS